MAVSSLISVGCVPAATVSKKIDAVQLQPHLTISATSRSSSAKQVPSAEDSCWERRRLLAGVGALALYFHPLKPLHAQVEELPENYTAFVDKADGYSYYYPSDWREFDFRAHDSTFKDRYLQLQNVSVNFIPTEKADLRDLGPMKEVVSELVNSIFVAPNQRATIYDMQERSMDGTSYYTFEYILTSPDFSKTTFATIAIANGRFYTVSVGANDRHWTRVRNKLKVVADSFKVLDI